jgi:hypothetical protein
MPCNESRVYTNEIVKDGARIELELMQRGIKETGLELQSQYGKDYIYQGNRQIGYLYENKLLMIRNRTANKDDIQNDVKLVKQAYSVGIVLVNAERKHYRVETRKVGNQYEILAKARY